MFVTTTGALTAASRRALSATGPAARARTPALAATQLPAASAAARGMARAAPANSGTKKKSSKDGIQDPRLQHIKSVLYDNAGATQGAPLVQAPSQREATEVSRKSAVYTGPDSARMQRETIERAWCLLKKQEADEITAGLRRRFLAMRSAMQELEQLDPRLFEGTQGRKEVELFPKRLRVPTETPPMLGWDYERNHNVAQN